MFSGSKYTRLLRVRAITLSVAVLAADATAEGLLESVELELAACAETRASMDDRTRRGVWRSMMDGWM